VKNRGSFLAVYIARVRWPPHASASEQLYELIYGHAGIGDDAAEGARSNLQTRR
jgi:hypothetical protein